ncbi:hypothetical protein SAMN02745194_03152 [Roseomonas rosea]|uniref:Uncharacterized protein n=1 Tax=Muricoccus roseus TaxID=198092 RepID=A0A1M6LFD4_9PROT|nr:hypothetical protein [Roseomonas rosea]SHJ69745.1 hypothetical protein SAMN02745194_03152 [Roseomonas rosea]
MPRQDPPAGGPSPWLTLIVAAAGSVLLISSNLISSGRESGALATELKSVREELATLRTGLAAATAAAGAGRAEARADLAALSVDIRALDKLVVELRATQASAERRWEEANRVQDDRLRAWGDVVTNMRDALVQNGLRLNPTPRRSGSFTLPAPSLELRPVPWVLPIRTHLEAP